MAKKINLEGFAMSLVLQNGGWQIIRVSKTDMGWLVTLRDMGGEYERLIWSDKDTKAYLFERMMSARSYHPF